MAVALVCTPAQVNGTTNPVTGTYGTGQERHPRERALRRRVGVAGILTS